MTKATSAAIVIALVVLMVCYADSWGLDAAQEDMLMTAVAEGSWREVEAICTDWKAKEPKSSVATWLLRGAYAEQNKMKQASMLWSELALLDEKRKNEAVTFAERMVKAHEGSAVAWALLSDAQARARMWKEALESADNAVSLDEECALPWRSKGAALWRMDRYEEALECCNRAIEINP